MDIKCACNGDLLLKLNIYKIKCDNVDLKPSITSLTFGMISKHFSFALKVNCFQNAFKPLKLLPTTTTSENLLLKTETAVFKLREVDNEDYIANKRIITDLARRLGITILLSDDWTITAQGPVGAVEMFKSILGRDTYSGSENYPMNPPLQQHSNCLEGPDFKATATVLAMKCNIKNNQ